jgi:hypothetical protein
MGVRQLRTASIKTGTKSNKLWDQDTQQGAIVPIATLFGTGAAATAFTFSNIPQIYRDLRLVVTGGTASADSLILVTFNGSFTTNLGGTRVSGNASSASSTKDATGASTIALGTCSTTVAGGFSTIVEFLDYTNTSTFKAMIARTSSDLLGSGGVSLVAGTWRSTDALTGFNFNTASAIAFQPGTTATLYGIKAGA